MNNNSTQDSDSPSTPQRMLRLTILRRRSQRRICEIVIIAALMTVNTNVSGADEMQVVFGEGSGWDGQKIPEGQHCDRFDGNGSTPPLTVTNIPPDAEAIIVEYSDRDSKKMNNGGHGKIGMKLESGATSVEFPSVPGHTFDLPENIFMVKAHRNPDWATEGAYMPPCSGGSGNTYYLTVIAARIKNFEKKKFKKLEKAKLVMGNY